MTMVTPERILIQQEETKFRAAVAESLMSRVAATANHIALYQANIREFSINGAYGNGIYPVEGEDCIIRFPFAWEIVDLYIWAGQVVDGTGQTELDIKWKPFASGTYQTIFSTTPKFDTNAVEFSTCGIGQANGGFIAPVLSKTQFDPYDQLRMDVISAISNGEGTGIGIVFRPR